MIKLLAVSGSPVEGSSTDLILDRLSEQLSQKIGKDNLSTERVSLNGLTIKPCQACGKAPDDAFCFYDDDMTRLYDQIVECDCFLFGSPIYFDTVSAQSKLFIDRCNCIRPPDFDNRQPEHLFIKRLTRKRPGAMVLVGGEKAWFEGARRTIAGFFKWIEVESHGLITYGSPDYNRKGTASTSDEVLRQVETTADRLREQIEANHA
ncbi:MAG: flavodoxin family protein [bacterium]|nr:flavodoxin family protein [bacterium]